MSTELAGTPTEDAELDQIIADLDCEIGHFPQAALRAAQQQREQIVPRLIRAIADATDQAEQGAAPDGNAHFFALILLAEFEAREALPVILRAVSLPGDSPFDLFGNAITECLCRVLAALTDETEELDRLISDRSIDEYVRFAAAAAYLLLVRDGRLSREDAVARLRRHLQTAIANGDDEGAGALVCELYSYAPHEALEEIREAYRLDLVDTWLIDQDFTESGIAEGDSLFRRELARCRPTGFADTVEELSNWYCFRDDDSSSRSDLEIDGSAEPDLGSVISVSDEAEDLDDRLERGKTVFRTERRVARNEPCPCGSGKKFKRCCGATV